MFCTGETPSWSPTITREINHAQACPGYPCPGEEITIRGVYDGSIGPVILGLYSGLELDPVLNSGLTTMDDIFFESDQDGSPNRYSFSIIPIYTRPYHLWLISNDRNSFQLNVLGRLTLDVQNSSYLQVITPIPAEPRQNTNYPFVVRVTSSDISSIRVYYGQRIPRWEIPENNVSNGNNQFNIRFENTGYYFVLVRGNVNGDDVLLARFDYEVQPAAVANIPNNAGATASELSGAENSSQGCDCQVAGGGQSNANWFRSLFDFLQ